jgi:hypothetical protein
MAPGFSLVMVVVVGGMDNVKPLSRRRGGLVFE